MKGKPKRLQFQEYLTPIELLKLLPISRSAFYKWTKEGVFGDKVRRDKRGKFYYAMRADVPLLIDIIRNK